jgi:uncharacterized protein with PIN domain
MNADLTPLSPDQVSELLRQIRVTRDQEFNCTECLQHIAEFSERKLTHSELNAIMESIEHHLSLCPECTEEYLALKKILEIA